MTTEKALFPTGQIVATPGAAEALGEFWMIPALQLIGRHVHGDWGEVSNFDGKQNDEALKIGARIFSAYTLDFPMSEKGVKVWVITEADRSSTCVLLPSEY
jgi:hypothetical protein